MGAAGRIYRNTAYLGVAEIVSRVLQFAIMLYAARLLSQESFGKFSFALSISFIAVILADMGINTLLVREIARDRKSASRYFINSLVVKAFLCIASFLFIVIALNAMGYPDETKKIVYIIWSFTVLSTFTELFYSIFRAFEMMIYDASLKVLRMVILASIGLYALFSGLGAVALSYSFVFAEAIVVMAAFIIALRKFVSLGSSIDLGFMKSLLKKAMPFGLAIIFGSIYFYIGSVILSYSKGDAEVAVFSAAYNIALAILFIPTVYTNAIYPVLSRYYKKSEESLRLLYERSFKYLYIIGLPISLGGYLLADRIISLLYGERYHASVIAFQVISVYLFLKFLNFLLGIVLSSTDRQGKRMLGQGITALFNVLLCLILIPFMGFVGAAIATLATEVFLFLIYYVFLSKSWYFFNFAKMLVRPAIASAAMSVFIVFSGFGMAATLALSVIIYFSFLLLLGTVDSEDRRIMMMVFSDGKLREN